MKRTNQVALNKRLNKALATAKANGSFKPVFTQGGFKKGEAVVVIADNLKDIGNGFKLKAVVDGKATVIDPNGKERNVKVNKNSKGEFVRLNNITHFI